MSRAGTYLRRFSRGRSFQLAFLRRLSSTKLNMPRLQQQGRAVPTVFIGFFAPVNTHPSPLRWYSDAIPPDRYPGFCSPLGLRLTTSTLNQSITTASYSGCLHTGEPGRSPGFTSFRSKSPGKRLGEGNTIGTRVRAVLNASCV